MADNKRHRADKLLEKMRNKQQTRKTGKSQQRKAVAKNDKEVTDAAKSCANPKPKKNTKHLFRLPDGSQFVCTYESSTQTWLTVLTVPGLPAYEMRGHSVHGQMAKIGLKWWKQYGSKKDDE